MRTSSRLFIAILLCIGLGACVNTGCNDFQSYRYADAKAPLSVPDDLEQPINESLAPEVQVADPNKIHLDASGECLDKPPKI